MMQGFHPFWKNHDRLPEDGGDQRLLLQGPDPPYPLGQIQSQGRTHGVMAQIVDTCPRAFPPLWAYEAWVARGVDWLAMTEDLPLHDNRVTVTPTAASGCSTGPTTSARTSSLVRETHAHPEAARASGR